MDAGLDSLDLLKLAGLIRRAWGQRGTESMRDLIQPAQAGQGVD